VVQGSSSVQGRNMMDISPMAMFVINCCAQSIMQRSDTQMMTTCSSLTMQRHKKLPEDAPVVSRLTLGPSFKVLGESTGSTGQKTKVKLACGRSADGPSQELYYPANHPKSNLHGAFKGLSKLLEERGIPGAQNLRLLCPNKGCPSEMTNCCAWRIMANQPDFLEQKTILQLLAESRSCTVITVINLPEFHCELNPIEQCWGAAKQVYQEPQNVQRRS
jgi:transposase